MAMLPVMGHTPGFAAGQSVLDIASAEVLLSQWFEAPVVLTSSGRAAMLLYFSHSGLNRYKHTIAIPRLISACVLDAVIRHGFPLDAANRQDASLTVFYHQYGFGQLGCPDGSVLEDICHSFFATPKTGARPWAGQAAVFSLPKFFRTAGMVGGLVVPDADLAEQLRHARDVASQSATPHRPYAALVASMADVSPHQLEHVYLDALLHPAPLAVSLGGMPANIAQICAVGDARRQILDQYLAASHQLGMPHGWREMLASSLPFVFPVFGPVEKLRDLNAELVLGNIQAGLYQIDIARQMSNSILQAAVLLPCHEYIDAHARQSVVDLLIASFFTHSPGITSYAFDPAG